MTYKHYTHASGDGVYRDAPSIHNWLRCVLYNRRSKMNPLWNTVIVAGKDYSGELINWILKQTKGKTLLLCYHYQVSLILVM